MQLLDAGQQLASRPTPNATVSPGWANNDTTGLTAPTIADPDCWNAVMAELANVVTGTGQTLSKTNVAQIIQGIVTLGGAYLADTGSANAYVVSFSSILGAALSAHIAGLPIRVKIGSGNTNTSTTPTLNDGAGAVTIVHHDGTPLAPGELQAAGVYTFIYDGTHFQMQRAATTLSVAGTIRKLSGSAAGGTKTASWSCDEIIAETALGGAAYKGASLTFNFNGAGTGAGGMDTGSTPTSADLHIYAIYNPATNTWNTLGTIAGSGATIYGGANMPAGYTASVLLWSGKTDGSGNIKAFVQQDYDIDLPAFGGTVNLFSAANGVTSYTTQSLSNAVPVNARSAKVSFGTNTSGTGAYILAVASDTSGTGLQTSSPYAGSGESFGSYNSLATFRGIKLTTAQQIAYRMGDTNAGVYRMDCVGYTL